MHKLLSSYLNLSTDDVEISGNTYLVKNNGKMKYDSLKDSFRLNGFKHEMINRCKEKAISDYIEFAKFFNSYLYKNHKRQFKIPETIETFQETISFCFKSKNSHSMSYKVRFDFKNHTGHVETLHVVYKFENFSKEPVNVAISCHLIYRFDSYFHDNFVEFIDNVNFDNNNSILVAYIQYKHYNTVVELFGSFEDFLKEFDSDLEVLVMHID